MKTLSFVLSFSYDDVRMKNEDVTILDTLPSITKERAKELLNMCKNEFEAGRDSRAKAFDCLASLISHLEANDFTGEELILFMLNGYKVSMTLNEAYNEAYNEGRESAMKDKLISMIGRL